MRWPPSRAPSSRTRGRALTDQPAASASEHDAVAAYKAVFKAVLDKRPSGMRLRLADALGKNRSFISQISNPVYATPIPAQHLNTIFQLCHFSAAEKAQFLAGYNEAHPQRADTLKAGRKERTVTLQIPSLGSTKKDGQLDALLNEFVRRLALLLRDGERAK
jgi:hypothetical protein